MATYIFLINWTDQGIRDYQDTTKRAENAAALAGSLGGSVKDIYWTLGSYDLVLVGDFPDDEAVTAFGLRTGSIGSVRTTTLRGFDQREIGSIIDRATQA
jgi:uncharacterized protein with GYD domain